LSLLARIEDRCGSFGLWRANDRRAKWCGLLRGLSVIRGSLNGNHQHQEEGYEAHGTAFQKSEYPALENVCGVPEGVWGGVSRACIEALRLWRFSLSG